MSVKQGLSSAESLAAHDELTRKSALKPLTFGLFTMVPWYYLARIHEALHLVTLGHNGD